MNTPQHTSAPPPEHDTAETIAGGPIAEEGPGSLKPLRNAVIAAVGVIAVFSMFLLSYSGAFANPKPHDIPVAVVAPQAVAAKLDATSALDVRTVPSASAARELVKDRTVYGAFVMDAKGNLSLDIASGGGRSVALALTTIAQTMTGEQGTTLTVNDLAPLGNNNPSGTFEFYCVLFLSIAAAMGATVLGRVLGTVRDVRHMLRRGAFLLGYTALLSGTFLLLADALAGALVGHAGELFLVFWAYTTAVCLAVTGIAARLGTVVALIVSMAITILGNASAGGPVAAPMLNSFFRAVNPVFPQGAGMTWIRGVLYFDDHGIGTGMTTLAVWAAVGLVLLFGAAFRQGRRKPAVVPGTEAPVAAVAG
ncbi:hypothetical protein [Streptomyces sp. NPDC005970]|uniref:hypothetical protein n=1 Tax=Streptomyces sp. NPDC005970 TaxID=3156723 RepID=UPI0034109BF3